MPAPDYGGKSGCGPYLFPCPKSIYHGTAGANRSKPIGGT